MKLFLYFFCTVSLFANIAGGHNAAVTSILHNGDTIITASEDGFIIFWDTQTETAIDRFALSPYKIVSMIKHPQKEEICIIEAGELDNYRISAWDYKHKTRLFSIHSNDPISFVNYSYNGTFIITAGLDGNHLTLIDSDSGKILSAYDLPLGTTSLGITGRTERTILLYQHQHDNFEGRIIYLDTSTGTITRQLQAPAGFTKPVIFGNNLYLAGISYGSLVLVNAATGEVTSRLDNFSSSDILFPAIDGFYCLKHEDNILYLYRFAIDTNSNLIIRQRNPVYYNDMDTISSFAYNGTLVFANTQGKLFFQGQQGNVFPFTFNNQSLITEIAASLDTVAVLTQDDYLFFLPLDYTLLRNNQNIDFTQKRAYTKINAVPNTESQFILWQNINTRNPPILIQSNNPNNETNLSMLLGRFPLRSLSMIGNRILTLDSSGSVSVRRLDNLQTRADFSFSSVGSIDARFADENYFILSRSVIGGNSPFIFVNYNTGETVPVPYNAQAGILTYTSKTGITYAAAVLRDVTWKKTVIMQIPGTSAASASVITEYPSEEIILSIAESGGSIAITVSGEGARIFANNTTPFERTPALPIKLISSENYFLQLDKDGNISWHDNKNGNILAIFKHYNDKWFLNTGNREISGNITLN